MLQYEGKRVRGPNGEEGVIQGGQIVVISPAPAAPPPLRLLQPAPPKTPAPQTPVDAERDVVGLQLDRSRLATVPADARKSEADARKAELELQTLERKAADPTGALSVEQGKATGFYSRAAKANQAYESTGVGAEPFSLRLGRMLLPESAEGYITSPERQSADANARAFISSVLRYESGAAIPPEEFESAYKTYFPQPGEAADTVATKQRLRKEALEALALGSGPGAGRVSTAPDGRADVGSIGFDMEEDAAPPTEREAALRAAVGELQAAFDKGATEEELVRLAGTRVNVTPEWRGRLREMLAARAKGKRVSWTVDRTGLDEPTAHDRAVEEEVEARKKAETASSDEGALLRQGYTFGLADEAAGIGRGLSRALQLRDPIEGYRLGRDVERAEVEQARNALGGTGTALEIGGSLLTGNISNALARAPTLLGRMGQGARAGTAAGATAGFGYGEGTNSLLSAGVGAAGGATIGAALPLAGQVVGNTVNALGRVVRSDPALPRRIVGQAIDADANTPRAAGAMLDDAHSRNSPMMLADTGENTRALLSSVGRQPGSSRRIAREAVIERQNAQAERIADAVRRDLGPTANIREMGEELTERAKTAARPLYQEAYAAPGASVVKLDDLATRPSLKRALKNAHNLAAEEGADPTALGFQLDNAGEVVLERVPSWQALDYVKRGLDDVVESYRDKTTGKLVLDGQGRAANATLRTLIARMDKVNPSYAAARAAYAGPAKLRDAMDKGVKALGRAPDDLHAEIKNLAPMELEAYRLGLRKAITDFVASRKDGGDKVAALLGTPKQRAALQRAFGGRQGFDKFIQTLRDEEAMGLTYRSTVTGSPTAERMATDATTNDTGLAETAMDAALRGGKDSMWSAAVTAIQKLRDVSRYGAGEAGERTRESIATLLTETDPAVLREIMVAARRAAAQQRVAARGKSRGAVRGGRNAGIITGMPAGRLTEERR